ncbi:uncharacterized protein LOC110852262 [Folsomia candida]|uniref:uncharacterized protein LOC110852262 n=1 Tax=Folsomia candida TaxID=158441 RepID=UPI000B8F16AB|nr:uncharacterized protein LOC110852262 [Folsomia candida]
MKVFFTLLAIIGLAQGSVIAKDTLAQLLGNSIDADSLQQARADASAYFDQVLANLREQMFLTGMNAIPLPDQVLEFEQVIGGITFHGQAALYNGTLLHLDTLHRTGVADIKVEENGDLVISAEVGVNQATLHYEMIAQFMDLGPHAIVDGGLSRVRLLMALRVDFSSMAVHMQTFDIRSTGVLSVDIKGLGAILNFLVEIVASFLGNLIKGIVAAMLEGPIKNIINKILADLFFPPTVFNAIRAVQAVVGASIM